MEESKPIQTYRDLRVWQEAVDLAERCLRLALRVNAPGASALTGQWVQAALSVAREIAAGHGAHARDAFRDHLRRALGAVQELETLLELARRLQHVAAADVTPITEGCDRLRRMLAGFIRSLQTPAS